MFSGSTSKIQLHSKAGTFEAEMSPIIEIYETMRDSRLPRSIVIPEINRGQVAAVPNG